MSCTKSDFLTQKSIGLLSGQARNICVCILYMISCRMMIDLSCGSFAMFKLRTVDSQCLDPEEPHRLVLIEPITLSSRVREMRRIPCKFSGFSIHHNYFRVEGMLQVLNMRIGFPGLALNLVIDCCSFSGLKCACINITHACSTF